MKYISFSLLAVLAYVLFEIGVFWYKYTHLPQLEDFTHTDQTLGQGTSLRYIAAGDRSAVGIGACSTHGCFFK